MQINGFEELADEMADLADSFGSMADRHGRENARTAIERGISRAMDRAVVPEARSRVPKDTGRLAESVDHEPRGWHGDTYRHAYGSTLNDEYARVQEFGTRKSSYVITPNGDYPLSFVWEDPPPGPVQPGTRVAFEFVVHPGVDVDQPGPMQSALKDNVRQIQGHVGRAIQDVLDDNID